jgi:hypothetical protein
MSAQVAGNNPGFLKTNFEQMRDFVTSGSANTHIQLGADQVCDQ